MGLEWDLILEVPAFYLLNNKGIQHWFDQNVCFPAFNAQKLPLRMHIFCNKAKQMDKHLVQLSRIVKTSGKVYDLGYWFSFCNWDKSNSGLKRKFLFLSHQRQNWLVVWEVGWLCSKLLSRPPRSFSFVDLSALPECLTPVL